MKIICSEIRKLSPFDYMMIFEGSVLETHARIIIRSDNESGLCDYYKVGGLYDIDTNFIYVPFDEVDDPKYNNIPGNHFLVESNDGFIDPRRYQYNYTRFVRISNPRVSIEFHGCKLTFEGYDKTIPLMTHFDETPICFMVKSPDVVEENNK